MSDEGCSRRLVLVTGAAGRIGSAFRAHAGERYRLRLADRRLDGLAKTPGVGHEIIQIDVADLDACRAACRDVHTVIHLAADPSPEADFYQSLLDNNIKGVYNIFQAAADGGCRRVIYASSVQAVLGHPIDSPVGADSSVRPINMYGAAKCFGEAVAACFARAGLSSIAVRIGAYGDPLPLDYPSLEYLSSFVSARDLNQLLVRCIEAENIEFAIVHGTSDNRRRRLDLSSTEQLLEYAPEDDAFQIFESRRAQESR
jgi:nucleoside-diphosphate-sugar epimerase